MCESVSRSDVRSCRGNPSSCLEGGIIQVFNLNTLKFQDSYSPTTWSEYNVPFLVTAQIGGKYVIIVLLRIFLYSTPPPLFFFFFFSVKLIDCRSEKGGATKRAPENWTTSLAAVFQSKYLGTITT